MSSVIIIYKPSLVDLVVRMAISTVVSVYRLINHCLNYLTADVFYNMSILDPH